MKKFKNYIAILAIVIVSGAFGQGLIIQNNNLDQVLYRRFENSISVAMNSIPFDEMNFRCVNCNIKPGKTENSIILFAKENRTAELYVSSKLNPDNEVKQVFRVLNLPNPQVFIGYKESGDRISLDELSKEIKVGYSSCFLLNMTYVIMSWEICKDGNCLSGTSNMLSQEAIALIESGSSKSFTLSVKNVCSDGIERILNADFIISTDK